MTQKQLNNYVNSKPELFRIENATENLSHKGEMPGNDKLGPIIQDMKLFLKNEGKK